MKKFKKFGIGLFAVLSVVATIVFFVLNMAPFGGPFSSTRLERMRASPSFHDGKFENSPKQKTDSSIIANYKLYSKGQKRQPNFEIPVQSLESSRFSKKVAPGLRAYWFGHASVLLEIDGLRVMTDPVFLKYASPFQVNLAPVRMHPVPLKLEDMPKIDAVVISHDHFDHLEMESTKYFASQGTHFYVGLGIGAHLERWSVPLGQIHEMDWWESADLGGIKIYCTPARHYSGRKSMDNSTLWSSWFIKGALHSFYYSGDTGYSSHFSEIKKRFGAPQLSIMKVGAYGSTWDDIHMEPEKSIQAHLDLGANTFLPVHWATFNMSYHAWDEPILRTLTEAKNKNVRVITPKVGEEFIYGKTFTNTEWYLNPSVK